MSARFGGLPGSPPTLAPPTAPEASSTPGSSSRFGDLPLTGLDADAGAAGQQSHAAKIAFEKYFLWKMRHGYVKLP
jgi:hypothetical protein